MIIVIGKYNEKSGRSPAGITTLLCPSRLLGGKLTPLFGKVFYGQEPPSGESTTTEWEFNYQLLAVIY